MCHILIIVQTKRVVMSNAASINAESTVDDSIDKQMFVHEYRFEYDMNGETPLTECLIDIIAFVTDDSRDEAKSLVHQRCRHDIEDHFSMLNRRQKWKSSFWVGSLNVTISRDGEIVVREL